MSFSVLPVSLWKKEYKFSLPPAQRGSHMLYFLSIMEVELHLKVFFGTSKTEFTINLTVCCNLLLISVYCRKKYHILRKKLYSTKN